MLQYTQTIIQHRSLLPQFAAVHWGCQQIKILYTTEFLFTTFMNPKWEW